MAARGKKTFSENDQADMKALGRRLRELREAKGYGSAERFANDHNIARAQYQLYEQGVTNVTYLTLKALAGHLDLSVSELLKGL